MISRRAPSTASIRAELLACLALLLVASCNAERAPAPRASASASASTAIAIPASPAKPASTPGETRGETAPAPQARASARTLEQEPTLEHPRLTFDEIALIGPAAPASAYNDGVVMVSRDDELVVVRLSHPIPKSAGPGPSRFQGTSGSAAGFVSVARGPAVGAQHAYWISKGRLVRRAFTGGELEVLSHDARQGTRVAVAGSPEIVAYVAEPAPEQDAKAWIRLATGTKLLLTPEGAAASSVSLAASGDAVIASFIDGRTGMTPVHARRVDVKGGALEPDVVVWVAGTTQAVTEITSVGAANGAWLLLPVERDASHFGLAALMVDRRPRMDPPLRWRIYPNGLDYAPHSAAQVCGMAMVAYVQPLAAEPGSRQELVLSELHLAENARSFRLATARGFADVSLHAAPFGAVLSYVADARTQARLLRCRKP